MIYLIDYVIVAFFFFLLLAIEKKNKTKTPEMSWLFVGIVSVLWLPALIFGLLIMVFAD